MRTTKTIRRGSKAKAAARRASDSGSSFKLTKVLNGLGSRASPAKAEPPAAAAAPASAAAAHSAAACSPITVLYVQGKSSSVSGCLNCFSTPLGREGRLRGFRCPKVLPRASSVISTAEGSSRRPSVHSACRAALRAAPEPAAAERDAAELPPPGTPPDRSREPAADRPHPAAPDPAPPLKPPRDPALTAGGPEPRPPPAPVQETLFGPPFTFSSVFSNTIFSEAAAPGGGDPPGPDGGGRRQSSSPQRDPSAAPADQTPPPSGDTERGGAGESGGEVGPEGGPPLGERGATVG